MSEYRPTEYVVDFGDCRSNQFVRLNMALIEQNGAKLHERIVRCRDCESSEGRGTVCWNDKFTYVVKLDGESRLAPAFVEPDGFCAWGERKVVDE